MLIYLRLPSDCHCDRICHLWQIGINGTRNGRNLKKGSPRLVPSRRRPAGAVCTIQRPLFLAPPWCKAILPASIGVVERTKHPFSTVHVNFWARNRRLARAVSAWAATEKRIRDPNKDRVVHGAGAGTADIYAGPLFRMMNRHGRILEKRLSAEAVGMAVKRHVEKLGYDPARFGGHSLRAGLATSAAAAGSQNAPSCTHQPSQPRHRGRYIRDGNLFRENAAQGLGLLFPVPPGAFSMSAAASRGAEAM
jgi:hypothetical protein